MSSPPCPDLPGAPPAPGLALPGTDVRRGLLLIAGAFSCFAFLDCCAKLAARELPVTEVAWFRFLLNFLIVAVLFNPLRAPEVWHSAAWGAQILRGLCQAAAAVFSFLALSHLHMAQALSIQFTTPICITLLSVVILREAVPLWRWGAILVGLAGVLLVTRPGAEGINPAFGFSFCSVVAAAGYAILTRQLARRESTVTMLFFMSGLPALVLTPLALTSWSTPQAPLTWLALLGTGAFGTLGHWLMIVAHRYAPASVLAPMQYSQFLGSVALGYMVFGEALSRWTLAGAAVLVGSGIFIWIRSRGDANRKGMQ